MGSDRRLMVDIFLFASILGEYLIYGMVVLFISIGIIRLVSRLTGIKDEL